jgi:hypothetical protein
MHISTSPTETTVQPQRVRRRKGLGFWTGRVLLGLVVMLVALAASGASYQAVATAIDRRSYPPPGQLIDVGGVVTLIVLGIAEQNLCFYLLLGRYTPRYSFR